MDIFSQLIKGRSYTLFLMIETICKKDLSQRRTSPKNIIVYIFSHVKKSIAASFNGSLSLEASLVVPIFIFALGSMIMLIEMERLQSNIFESLHQSISYSFDNRSTVDYKKVFMNYLDSKENPYICLDKGAEGITLTDSSSIDDDGYIRISAEYKEKPFISLFPLMNAEIKDSIFGHSFTGYVNSNGKGNYFNDDIQVYVTLTGVKYHKDRECSYIKVKLNKVMAADIKMLRNASGKKYSPCHECHPKLEGTLFIAEYGDKYHSSNSCTAIKKTVKTIGLKEAISEGYTACSKCG